MYRLPVLALVIAMPALVRAEDPKKDLAAVMISGKWEFVHGTPPLADRHVYTFAKDGTFTCKLHSDFTTEPKPGRWELVGGKDGKVMLRMKYGKEENDKKFEDSEVRYDAKKDELTISGGRFAVLKLQHIKEEKKDK